MAYGRDVPKISSLTPHDGFYLDAYFNMGLSNPLHRTTQEEIPKESSEESFLYLGFRISFQETFISDVNKSAIDYYLIVSNISRLDTWFEILCQEVNCITYFNGIKRREFQIHVRSFSTNFMSLGIP